MPVLCLKVDDEDGAIGHWISLSLSWVLAANIVSCDDSRHWRNRQNQGQYRQMSEIRIDVVLYPGAQLAAAMGLADLFVVANRIAEGIDQIPSRFRVRHLRTGKGDRKSVGEGKSVQGGVDLGGRRTIKKK